MTSQPAPALEKPALPERQYTILEGFFDEMENTHKMTVRLSPVTEYRLDRDYRLDGSRSKNEFIERAITRRLDLLEAEQNELLPAALQSAVDGRLGMFEDRMAKLLYKLAVEHDMGLSVLLDYLKIDPDYLSEIRVDSVKNVRATGGHLTFERKARERYDESEDDSWQD